MKVLTSIGTGKCTDICKSTWIRNIRYALKTKTNPLKLTDTERKKLTEKVKSMASKNAINNHAATLKKYRTRNSPPYPANKNCNKTMKGNDGKMYISRPNKNNICSWKKVTTK